MRGFFLTLLISYCFAVAAQNDARLTFPVQSFTFQPLALAEPPMAIGFGYSRKWTKRSEVFTELSYLTSNPLFPDMNQDLQGLRFLLQYRYHFTSLVKPRAILWRQTGNHLSFVAIEFRLKNYLISGTENFVNPQLADTIFSKSYQAQAIVVGGAILIGEVYNLSANGKLQLETSIGLGAKQKFVRFKNVPTGYQVMEPGIKEWAFVPKIYEAGNTVYLPFAIRLRYRIG